MIKTVKQACRFNPIIQDYRMAQGIENLAEPQTVVRQLQDELPDFIEIRPLLIDLLQFIHNKAAEPAVRDVAEVFANRLSNVRALGQ